MRKTSIAVKSSKHATKLSPARPRLLLALLAFSSLTSGGAALAAGGALPTGGHFVGGSGAITQGGNHLTVNQSSQLGIINWQSFSIGKGNSVTIANGKGATFNRVTGGDMSTIAGSLKSTGSVYIVNQAGVLVGPSGRIDTNGSFVASTRDVTNSAFMAGGKMVASGESSGTVDNQGTITSANGDVVLVGKSVSNSGTISAANGSAALAAGDKVLLQASGDDTVLIQTRAGSGDVTNTGTVQAAQVALNAKGGNVYALAVNDGGVIRATGTATKEGRVYLTAGEDLTVNSSVSANNANGSGGKIVATANAVSIGAKAKITADGVGNTNGGTIMIGGDRHGGTDRSAALSKTAIANAQTNTVAASARISANAGTKGNGGNVIIWSDKATNYQGKISAKGGAGGGDGGFVEVSGEDVLGFSGRVDTTARRGKTGTLLLDPSDVTIYSSTDSVLGGSGTSGETQSGGNFNPNSGTSFILNTDIDAALATSNVVISTGSLADGLGGTGNIHIGTNNGNAFDHAAPIHWNTANSLTLNAVGIIDTPGGNPNNTTGGFSPDHPGVLIDSEGGGAIFFNAGGNGQTPGIGSTVISLQGNIMGSGGLISLVATNPGFRIEFNNNQGITNSFVSSALPGKVILQADEVHLGTSTGPSGFVTTTGEVDIAPTSAGAIVLGDNSASGDFSSIANTALIRAEDVINITADTLVIGSASTTSLTLMTANPTGHTGFGGVTQFDAGDVQNLKLLTGTSGSVSEDANTSIIVNDPGFTFTAGSGGLAVQTGGAITLGNAQNSVGSIAFKQTGAGGNISFTSATSTNNTLVVGTVGDVSGISTAGARTVTLNIGGDTVTQSAGATNAIAPSSGSIKLELTGTDSSFTLNNPANAVKTIAADVQALTFFDNVGLSTGTAGATTAVTASGNITIVDNGNLTVGSGAGITSTAGNIRVEDQTFTNSDAGNAFSAGSGKTWRVYSQNPTLDSANTAALSYSFVQYGAANSYANPFSTANAALDSHATGNGFLYTVSPTAAVTLTGTFNKNYDGTNAVTQTIGNSVYGTVTGTINGDVVTFTSLSDSNATYSSKNAGTNLPITLSQTVGVASAVDSNGVTVYGYGNNVTNNLKGTISPLAITLTANDRSKTYGQLLALGNTGFTLTSGSLVSGESIGTATLTSLGTPKTADAGSYNINISNAAGSGGFLASNYDITYVKGTLTVDKAALTFTPKAVSVGYDGTTLNNTTYSDTLGNYTIAGFQNSDTAGNSGLTLTGSMAFGGSTGTTVKNARTYSQGVGTLSLSSTNYTLTFTNPAPHNYVITPAALTITASDQSKTYGQTKNLGSTAFTTSGLVSGETIDSATLGSSGTPATADAGNYAINISNASGSHGFLASNYAITYDPGTLTVNPARLIITIGDQSKTYGQLGNLGTTGFTTGLNQLKNGDTVTSVALASTGAPKTANVGDYDITGSNPTGSSFNPSNYNISYVTGTLTVNPAELTFTPVAFQKVYDGVTLNNTSYSDDLGNYTITGYVNGQNATSAGISLGGSMAFNGSTTAVVKNANTYTQAAGTLSLTSNHGNYVLNFTNPHPNNYVITPASVTLADISGTRVYDGTTNANGSYLSVTDLISGDQVSVAGVGTLASKDVGKEQITDLGTLRLTGADAGNYTLSASNPNDFVIVTKATLTVSAVTQTKVYDGTTTSTLTPTIAGLQTGDSVTGTNSQSYNARDVLGTNGSTLTALHDIGVNDGNSGGNYKIVYVTAKGTITPEHVTVTATPNTKTYDGTTTATATPIVTSGIIYDPDTGHFTESYNTQHAGTGLTLTPTGSISDGNGGNNYIITFVPISGSSPGPGGKSGIIDPAPLTISAVTQTKVYDGTVTSTDTPIITAGGLIGGDTLTNLSQSYNSKNVLGPNGSTLSVNSDYVLTNASDYKVTLLTAPGTITPLAIDATGTRVYNGTPDVDGSILTITNLVPGDDLGLVGTGTSSSPHVGTHNITGGNLALVGLDADNYTLVGGHETVKITPFAVVLFGTRVYDGDTDGDSSILAVTNAFKGDEVTVTSGTSTIISKDVGRETITDFGTLTLGGASAGDYTLVGAKGVVKVTPEAITVMAVPGTKVYDGTETSTGTPIVTSGTIFTGDTGDFIQTYGSQHAGTDITLTPSGSVNDGNRGKNYTITYVPITDGIINPRPVDLTGTRPFDGGTDANSTILTITNLVPGDVVAVGGSTGTVISPNVGPEKIVDFTGLTLGGSSSGDYTLVGATGIVTITPGLSPNNSPGSQINNQTASGNGTQSNFVVPDSGLISLTPRQNGIVTGTIATIDGTDYQPDSQLGCTLGQTGCIQNGVAPTTTSTPQ